MAMSRKKIKHAESIPTQGLPLGGHVTDATAKNTPEIDPEEWARRKVWAKQQLAEWVRRRDAKPDI
jgi:hypothetical protein